MNQDQRIHDAAKKGDLKALQEELDKGVSVNLAGYSGWSPLDCAVLNDKLDAAKLVIERKAAVDEVRNGLTALHLACTFSDDTVVAFLLDSGADIDKRDNGGKTPLTR